MSFHVPHQLRRHPSLLGMAFQFDKINPQTSPNMLQRIAAKEALIEKMAKIIVRLDIPLLLAFVAPDHGLKAAFTRAIGETGELNLLGALEKIASDTKPEIQDLNLKWQLIRAYRFLNFRFPEDSEAIVISARSIIDDLSNGADAPLIAGIAEMRKILVA
jgi:hypothetical protein